MGSPQCKEREEAAHMSSAEKAAGPEVSPTALEDVSLHDTCPPSCAIMLLPATTLCCTVSTNCSDALDRDSLHFVVRAGDRKQSKMARGARPCRTNLEDSYEAPSSKLSASNLPGLAAWSSCPCHAASCAWGW